MKTIHRYPRGRLPRTYAVLGYASGVVWFIGVPLALWALMLYAAWWAFAPMLAPLLNVILAGLGF